MNKYNLCYNNTIINFYNFNLLNISNLSNKLKIHYNNDSCYINDSSNNFKYNLLDKNKIYTTTALVSHQTSRINSFQYLFNLLNYSKLNNSFNISKIDTFDIPNINKNIEFLNYTDNKNLWNSNSNNINFENTKFNINKFYIQDPNDSDMLYKIIMYETTNIKESKYKNNIYGLKKFNKFGKELDKLTINNNKTDIIRLLSVDNIKIASIHLDIRIINSNNVSITPTPIKNEYIFDDLTNDNNKDFDHSKYNINTERKFTYYNDNKHNLQINNNTLYLPIGRIYRLEQTTLNENEEFSIIKR